MWLQANLYPGLSGVLRSQLARSWLCILSPGLILSQALLSKPQAAFQERLDYRLPCSEPMEKRASVAPTSQRVVRFTLIGTLRSLPILEATTVGPGNEDIHGVKPINSPQRQSRSDCMTESWGERLPEAAPAAVPGRP